MSIVVWVLSLARDATSLSYRAMSPRRSLSNHSARRWSGNSQKNRNTHVHT
jgi:hypothetical protein